MKAVSRLLASGPGWRVTDIACAAGPLDRPFEERHDEACIAVVTRGSFRYRSAQGTALLVPGAVLLGNAGQCFECGHEHAVGDRCLAVHLAPDLLESVAAALPGVRTTAFAIPRLPPLPSLLPLLAAAETLGNQDVAAGEELALTLAGAALAPAEPGRAARSPSRHDERRITDAVRRIEAEAEQPLTLASLAGDAGMSPYHFLRTFRTVVGMTPHQLVLHTRLRRAALLLRRTDRSVTDIAYATGFGDLSTFNRRFRRTMGRSPGEYRRRASATAHPSRRSSLP